MSRKTQEVIGLGLLGLLAIAVFASVAQNAKASPNLRFIAQTAEGQVVQDMETGLIHLLLT